MATYTRLADADVAELAAAFGLGEVLAWQPIAAGTINTSAAVDTERGRVCLRINEGKSEADVRYEAELVSALVDAGVPAPRPLLAADGAPLVRWRGKLASAFAWVAGAHRGTAEAAAGAIRPVHAAAVGRALATLHRAGLAVAGRFERPGTSALAFVAGRFERFRDTADPALLPAVAIIRDELAHLAGQGELRARAPMGVIHADLFPDNVMWDGDALVAMLDFEQACTGSLVYDLAVCVNAWCWRGEAGASGTPGAPVASGRFDPALVRALAGGYGEVRALGADEVAALPIEVRAAAVRFTVTRITDVYLPGLDNPGKDFRAFVARLTAWRQVDPADLLTWAGLV